MKKPLPLRKVVRNRPRIIKPRSVKTRLPRLVNDYDIYVYDGCSTVEKNTKLKGRNVHKETN